MNRKMINVFGIALVLTASFIASTAQAIALVNNSGYDLKYTVVNASYKNWNNPEIQAGLQGPEQMLPAGTSVNIDVNKIRPGFDSVLIRRSGFGSQKVGQVMDPWQDINFGNMINQLNNEAPRNQGKTSLFVITAGWVSGCNINLEWK